MPPLIIGDGLYAVGDPGITFYPSITTIPPGTYVAPAPAGDAWWMLLTDRGDVAEVRDPVVNPQTITIPRGAGFFHTGGLSWTQAADIPPFSVLGADGFTWQDLGAPIPGRADCPVTTLGQVFLPLAMRRPGAGVYPQARQKWLWQVPPGYGTGGFGSACPLRVRTAGGWTPTLAYLDIGAGSPLCDFTISVGNPSAVAGTGAGGVVAHPGAYDFTTSYPFSSGSTGLLPAAGTFDTASYQVDNLLHAAINDVWFVVDMRRLVLLDAMYNPTGFGTSTLVVALTASAYQLTYSGPYSTYTGLAGVTGQVYSSTVPVSTVDCYPNPTSAARDALSNLVTRADVTGTGDAGTLLGSVTTTGGLTLDQATFDLPLAGLLGFGDAIGFRVAVVAPTAPATPPPAPDGDTSATVFAGAGADVFFTVR